MSLYPKNDSSKLDENLFRNPTSEYRGAPFWAWNHHLDKETIREQIGYFKEMGMGGAHAHVRTGLDTPYLGEAFMEMMQAGVDAAKANDLLYWLYDEDRWPSGAAGGLVTKNPDYAQKQLLFTAFPKEAEPFTPGQHLRHDTYYELAQYQVELTDGKLSRYTRTEDTANWYAYLYLTPKSPWFNNESYIDTLKKEAVEAFLNITHETYAKHFQADFGKTIPAIFTDEPQFARKGTLTRPEEPQEVSIPFTDDLEETYRKAYGESLLDHLPELFWETDGVSITRYHYHDHVCERFAEAFADTIGTWCDQHGLMLTGHMMEEPTLHSQTGMLGEAMRSYRGFGLPGIDMLCDRREYTTAKQAQSASHQLGRPGVLSELYGVTNWDYDFRGHKLQGDWQAALGVTTRVHHLTWMSMEGEAKRDYPACIGYQSPWYKQYPYVEDHFARVNTAMTRGKAEVHIGVLHPIESYWLYYGSNEKTGAIREEMDAHFDELNQWLLTDALDFDYISESLLESLSGEEMPGTFTAGNMHYDVVLVPDLVTIRSTTLQKLEAFAEAGGAVIFVGRIPYLLDGKPSDRAQKLADRCQQIAFTRTQVLEALEPWREVEILSLNGHTSPLGTCAPGTHTLHLLHQLRRDGEDKWLFIAHGTKMSDPDQPHLEKIEIRIHGTFGATLYNTMDGTTEPLKAGYQNGKSVLQFGIYEHDSMLLHLTPVAAENGEPVLKELHPSAASGSRIPVPNTAKVTLEEDNVVVLDLAEYKLDDGDWQEKEEILRLDNAIRDTLGFPQRKKQVAQPWVLEPGKEYEHTVALRFTFEADFPIEGLSLAMENFTTSTVLLDGKELPKIDSGWYVDRSIRTMPIGHLEAGLHQLKIRLPYGLKTNLEDSYLLGCFSTKIIGTEIHLTSPKQELSFTDLSAQGLAFYGGNLTYIIPVEAPEDGILHIQATKFRAPLWSATLDGGEEHLAAYTPYTVDIPVREGTHTLRLKLYGSRINTFGQLHDADETMDWFGPDSWRTEGAAWSYEYQLHRTGFLKRPEIIFTKETLQ